MKRELFSGLICFATLFPLAVQADSATIDISTAVRELDLDGEIKRALPGNATTVEIEHAVLVFSPQELGGNISFRLHIKDQHQYCVKMPFTGKKYCKPIDNYNGWTTLGTSFKIVEKCRVQDVNIYKNSTSGVTVLDDVLLGIIHEIFKIFKPMMEFGVSNLVNEKIKNMANPHIRMVCS